jgi:uroporphyrinogen III methyltransferase/synthase
MVTRPPSPRDPLAERLCNLGADVVRQPAIRIEAPLDWQPVDDALARLPAFDWLVFSSANGVRCLLDRFRGNDAAAPPLPPSLRLAAIGPGTAEELRRYRLQADLVPETFLADSLAESLRRDARGRRFLLVRASRGREVLAEQLAAAGAEVEQIVVYRSLDETEASAQVVAMLTAGEIHWITVTSSAIARSLVRLFGDHLRRSRLASISPLTSGVLRDLGYPPTAEATEYTMPGLVAAVVNAVAMDRQ